MRVGSFKCTYAKDSTFTLQAFYRPKSFVAPFPPKRSSRESKQGQEVRAALRDIDDDIQMLDSTEAGYFASTYQEFVAKADLKGIIPSLPPEKDIHMDEWEKATTETIIWQERGEAEGENEKVVWASFQS